MGKQSEKKISANRTKIIITVLLVVTFVALAVTIWVLFSEILVQHWLLTMHHKKKKNMQNL